MVREFDDNALVQAFDAVHFIMNENKEMFEMVKKMKRILKAAQQMTTSLVLSEAIEKICEETIDTLNCDRASLFLLDSAKGELWSKAAKGTETIRIPWNKGVVGKISFVWRIVLNAYIS